MGRLSGLSYRELTKKLRKLGFRFDRSARGSHEIKPCRLTAYLQTEHLPNNSTNIKS